MRDETDKDRRRPGVLSAGELQARRGAWRRRRTRRRLTVAGCLLAVVVLAILAVAASGGSSSGGHRPFSSGAPASLSRQGGGGAEAGGPRRPPGHSQVVGQSRAVDHVLRYTSYVRLAGHRRRDIALTFDDGPSPYTPQILRVLRRMHVPATFFVIGRSALAYPQFVAAEVQAGCEVGDHTETHPPLALLSPSAQTAQLTQAAEVIQRAGAPRPIVMRPPYGSFDPATLEVLRAERMLMVLWSADTSDYMRPGVQKIVYTAVSGAQPGAIILMHDGGGDRAETVAALPRIIMRLRQRGFHLVTVSRLVADDPPPAGQPPPQPLSGAF